MRDCRDEFSLLELLGLGNSHPMLSTGSLIQPWWFSDSIHDLICPMGHFFHIHYCFLKEQVNKVSLGAIGLVTVILAQFYSAFYILCKKLRLIFT